MFDAHVGWGRPGPDAAAGTCSAAGIHIEPFVEVEEARAALHLVARGVGDTVVSRVVLERISSSSGDTHLGVHAVTVQPPLYNTFAVVQRRDVQLAPATEQLTRLALELLLCNPSLLRLQRPVVS